MCMDELSAVLAVLVQRFSAQPAPAAAALLVDSSPAALPSTCASCGTSGMAGCRNFLLECELYLADFSELTQQQRIFAVIQRLTGKALEWASAV